MSNSLAGEFLYDVEAVVGELSWHDPYAPQAPDGTQCWKAPFSWRGSNYLLTMVATRRALHNLRLEVCREGKPVFTFYDGKLKRMIRDVARRATANQELVAFAPSA